ncbi:hypothetical protein [Saccharothrix texasensis]|uniref:hypothetical protein n=1 Tax=Saccharothrix texasensis TaxID=103734 RepID=UPI0011CDA518|nr:hypothetical protein [Saccharothrix texasensis]
MMDMLSAEGDGSDITRGADQRIVGSTGEPEEGRGRPDDAFALTLTREERLHYYAKYAQRGDPSSARRVAEILEFLGEEEESAAWWLRAAHLGDPDALDYLQELVDTTESDSETPPLRHIS